MPAFPLIGFVKPPPGSLMLPGTPSAAWFLRRVITGYTGNLLKVRRSSNDELQDIGQSGMDLDTSALLSFCGAGNGFVHTVYDQVGTNHLTQTTNGAQPMIVSSGSLVTLGGEPAMDLDGTDDFLQSSAAMSTFVSAAEGVVAGVINVDAIDTNSINAYNNDPAWADSLSFLGMHLHSDSAGTLQAYNWDGIEAKAQESTAFGTGSDVVHIWQHLPSGGVRLECWANGSHPNPSTSGGTSDLTGTLRLGRNYASAYLNGKAAGLVTYSANLSTADIGLLGTVLAGYYGITWA